MFLQILNNISLILALLLEGYFLLRLLRFFQSFGFLRFSPFTSLLSTITITLEKESSVRNNNNNQGLEMDPAERSRMFRRFGEDFGGRPSEDPFEVWRRERASPNFRAENIIPFPDSYNTHAEDTLPLSHIPPIPGEEITITLIHAPGNNINPPREERIVEIVEEPRNLETPPSTEIPDQGETWRPIRVMEQEDMEAVQEIRRVAIENREGALAVTQNLSHLYAQLTQAGQSFLNAVNHAQEAAHSHPNITLIILTLGGSLAIWFGRGRGFFLSIGGFIPPNYRWVYNMIRPLIGGPALAGEIFHQNPHPQPVLNSPNNNNNLIQRMPTLLRSDLGDVLMGQTLRRVLPNSLEAGQDLLPSVRALGSALNRGRIQGQSQDSGATNVVAYVGNLVLRYYVQRSRR